MNAVYLDFGKVFDTVANYIPRDKHTKYRLDKQTVRSSREACRGQQTIPAGQHKSRSQHQLGQLHLCFQPEELVNHFQPYQSNKKYRLSYNISCTRGGLNWTFGGLDWTLGGISLPRGWSNTGTGFLGRRLMPVFNRHLDNALNSTL